MNLVLCYLGSCFDLFRLQGELRLWKPQQRTRTGWTGSSDVRTTQQHKAVKSRRSLNFCPGGTNTQTQLLTQRIRRKSFYLPRSWAHGAFAVVSLPIMPLKLTWTMTPTRTTLEDVTYRNVRLQPIRTSRDTTARTALRRQTRNKLISADFLVFPSVFRSKRP